MPSTMWVESYDYDVGDTTLINYAYIHLGATPHVFSRPGG